MRLRYPELITYLGSAGYNVEYISKISKLIRTLLSMEADERISSYEDFFHYFNEANGYSESHDALRSRKSLIGIIKAFDLYGTYPDGVTRSCFMKECSRTQLSPYYENLLATYETNASATGKRVSTIRQEANNGATFFMHLQSQGAADFTEVTAGMVQDFFFRGGEIIRGHSYMKNVRAVVIGSADGHEEENCARIASYLPPLRASRKNFDYLKDDEAEKIRAWIADKTAGSIRNRLVMALPFYYGLRGVDVAQLGLGNIDWVNDSLKIRQSKTGDMLELPLLPIVGNLILSLLESEPEARTWGTLITDDHVKGRPLPYGAISQIVRSGFVSAGVRTEDGAKGLRVLRHHAATTMLTRGVPSPVIGAILGHRSPESVVPYIDSSIEDLRRSSLSLDSFPVNPKIFKP